MVKESALSQDYILYPGDSFEDFENAGEWQIAGSGTFEANMTQYKTGSQSLKFYTTSEWPGITAQKVIDLPALHELSSIWIYLHSGAGAVYIYLYGTPDGSKNFSTGISTSVLRPGWNRVVTHRDSWIGEGADDWNTNRVAIKIRVTASAGQALAVSLDDMRINTRGSPRLLIAFDDSDASIYYNAYKYMHSKGLRATNYCTTGWVGKTNQLTLANLKEMYAGGWTIANHTHEHSVLTTLSQAAQQLAISTCKDWLIANGFPRGAHHFAYPGGAYNSDTLIAMANLGMLTGRGVNPGIQMTPPQTLFDLNASDIAKSTSLAAVKGYVDLAIKNQGTYIMFFHKIVKAPVSGIEWPRSDFRDLIDYIVKRKVQCVTIDEWYYGLTDSRYRGS